ncbi:hypothetical protein K3U93_07465 [Mycobacterium malmoense]|uniref:Uncharacterized protein n=1 Tax=Mycobacterium malmoense TaxID=1780 RepID=A0ABX3SS76_MYCMA|nr:hypothetical protein [Mycobacterium malmoense]OIN78531.1 hypothetical protein BMG05_22795 [Mycobacterium malmoense]ORA82808.1 hypothetical protein BST29_11165 [Mycobacterium malmoense]QZA18971.1 hypothetical protein K3U93_07465 [Mycobacterium malmoense]UNB95738.1 hypothetical protein H5T25_07455 [Mycobacterium malmoense]
MEPGNLDSRVTDLEHRVRDLAGRVQASEQDAAAARVLAGAADRDVSEFRSDLREFRQATTASFNALREDFVDLRDHVDQGFTQIRSRFDATAAGQQQIVDLLQIIITDQGDRGPTE